MIRETVLQCIRQVSKFKKSLSAPFFKKTSFFQDILCMYILYIEGFYFSRIFNPFL